MYHNIPIKINDQFKLQKDIEQIKSSIDAFLELIIFTPRGGFRADYDFGFEFWNNEFQNILIEDFNQSLNESTLVSRRGDSTSKTQCVRSLKKTIETYETRLKNVRIEMNLQAASDSRSRSKRNIYNSKYEVEIVIEGEIQLQYTTEQYYKRILFTVGPAIKK